MDAVIALRAAELSARNMGLKLVETLPRLRVLVPGETHAFSVPDVQRVYLLSVEAGVVVESSTGSYNLRAGGEQGQIHEGEVRMTNNSNQLAQVEFLVAQFGQFSEE